VLHLAHHQACCDNHAMTPCVIRIATNGLVCILSALETAYAVGLCACLLYALLVTHSCDVLLQGRTGTFLESASSTQHHKEGLLQL
jgi:hypothetical protein